MAERFTNARVHKHLTPALDAAVVAMHATRLTINSAALRAFLTRLTPAERAELLGEYTKVLAMPGPGRSVDEGRRQGEWQAKEVGPHQHRPCEGRSSIPKNLSLTR